MNTITDTIIEHTGGRLIFKLAFTRALCGEREVTYQIAPALVAGVPGRATHVRVTLEPGDTYRAELLCVPPPRSLRAPRTLADEGGLYADQLRPAIERLTGLYLRF